MRKNAILRLDHIVIFLEILDRVLPERLRRVDRVAHAAALRLLDLRGSLVAELDHRGAVSDIVSKVCVVGFHGLLERVLSPLGLSQSNPQFHV